jgi:hypothetical protein
MIPDKRAIAQILDNAPGPLPWYGRTAGNRLYSGGLEFEWSYSEEIHQSLLVKRNHGEQFVTDIPVFGVAKMYTYVKAISADRFALWWQRKAASGRSEVQFRVYNSTALRQIDDWRGGLPEAVENLIGASEISTFAIPATLDDGLNCVALPRPFSRDSEILVLVNRATVGMDICIWSIDTKSQTVFVMPQQWWNKSDADFGYQWISRVARDALSGLIVGDGVRIDPFVLDASGLKRGDGY